MGKHADKIGSFEDFKAPWETESGDEAEVDKGKLKRLMYNARRAEAVALDERDEAKEAVKAAETERDEAKEEAAKASPDEANRKIARFEKQVADLTAERDELVAANEQRELRAEVLGDLPAKYAKYVTGTTKEELEKSLEDVKADFGLEDGDGEGGDDDEPQVRTTPRSRLRNGADPEGTQMGSDEVDFDKAAEEILGRGVFG